MAVAGMKRGKDETTIATTTAIGNGRNIETWTTVTRTRTVIRT